MGKCKRKTCFTFRSHVPRFACVCWIQIVVLYLRSLAERYVGTKFNFSIFIECLFYSNIVELQYNGKHTTIFNSLRYHLIIKSRLTFRNFWTDITVAVSASVFSMTILRTKVRITIPSPFYCNSIAILLQFHCHFIATTLPFHSYFIVIPLYCHSVIISL